MTESGIQTQVLMPGQQALLSTKPWLYTSPLIKRKLAYVLYRHSVLGGHKDTESINQLHQSRPKPEDCPEFTASSSYIIRLEFSLGGNVTPYLNNSK